MLVRVWHGFLNSLSNHALFGGQNGVMCGASGWFTVKKGELINTYNQLLGRI